MSHTTNRQVPGSPFTAWTSTFDPTTYGDIYTTYDNFTLAGTTTVTDLTWQGFSFDATTLGPTAIPVQSFTIGFYADNAGVPGALLTSESVAFTASVAGTVDFFGNSQTETVYDFAATLPAGFTAAAATTYWMSVQGVTDYPAFWT